MIATMMVEYRLQKDASNSDYDEFIYRKIMSSVPLPGELININGNPYIVVKRGWATDGECSSDYCYMTVVKAGDF